MSGEVFFIFCLISLFVVLLVFSIILLAVWVWMLGDWNARQKTNPETAERYKIQMIIGWPFGYYLNVYRKSGPARR